MAGDQYGKVPVKQSPVLESREKWLEGWKERIFIVCLKGSDRDGAGIDHVLVVYANKSVFLDCVEQVTLKLRLCVLAACLGDGNSIDEVAEIRRLEV